VKNIYAHTLQGEFGKLYVQASGLGFRQDRRRIAPFDFAKFEHGLEHVDPFTLDTIYYHVLFSLLYVPNLAQRILYEKEYISGKI
tara:strand:- start:241 stop:495 length:255 start_codon:yes stop_codon:yes gene_type:complete